MKIYNVIIGGKNIEVIQNEDGTFTKPEIIEELLKFGTAMKPAHEPICMARKPLAEKTVAENCLKYGTGGINIDESRVETSDNLNGGIYSKGEWVENPNEIFGARKKVTDGYVQPTGRFPANLIHDNSEEVRECFPNDSERFFKSILYYPKASKSERNKGMDELEAKPMYKADGSGQSLEIFGSTDGGRENRKNNHPTVKPVALMSYLIKMITPKGGIVLDPFTGSGSTLVAAKENGFQYIGIEMTEEYLPIIQARTGCEIIKPEMVEVEETIKDNVVVEQKVNGVVLHKDICECGGKIKKIASGRVCESCMKEY